MVLPSDGAPSAIGTALRGPSWQPEMWTLSGSWAMPEAPGLDQGVLTVEELLGLKRGSSGLQGALSFN